MNLDPGIASAFLQAMDFEPLVELVRAELCQREQEGYDVSAFRPAVEQPGSAGQMIQTYLGLQCAPRKPEFRFDEPETLAGIQAARPSGPRQRESALAREVLLERIQGAWLGRAAGCLLGKPVELWASREKIARYLKLAGAYPLSDYIPRLDPLPADFDFAPQSQGCFRGEICAAPQDDDTDYSILGLHILESHGLDFSTAGVAAEWLGHLAYLNTWTAERAVYRNLVLGIPPLLAAHFFNPEREFIGARIRVDVYGLACPGNPQRAAELAYRDAALSHCKNGVYSAMFMAACTAWSFVTADVAEIIRVGLSEIPVNCRQAQAIRDALQLHQGIPDWETACDRLLAANVAYPAGHAINNTALMTLAMLYGGGDFEKTICLAVMGGLDTDCNAANAGTVLGVLTGAAALPSRWTSPLHDTLHSAVTPFGTLSLSALARRTSSLVPTPLLTVH